MGRLRVIIALCAVLVTGSSPAQKKPPEKSGPSVAQLAGELANNVYRNGFVGFSCKVPFGWVDRTDDMREGAAEPVQQNHTEKRSQPVLLLATFERPPDATAETVNSAIVIAAEPVSDYPGLRDAGHYFGPLTDLTKDKGFSVVNEPYEFSVGAKPLMRGDFSKPLGKLTMYQSTLVIVEKSYVVSFTFIGGTEDEVDELVEGLVFEKAQAPARP